MLCPLRVDQPEAHHRRSVSRAKKAAAALRISRSCVSRRFSRRSRRSSSRSSRRQARRRGRRRRRPGGASCAASARETPSSAATCLSGVPRPHQLDRLTAELRRVRRSGSRQWTPSCPGLAAQALECPRKRVNSNTGELMPGRMDATPAAVARWAERFAGQRIDVAVEACTGWLFVCDALAAAGAVPHLAEPVETRALRGRKATREDRSRGRALAARAAGRRPASRGVDPARARAPMALTRPAAAHVAQ